MVSFMETDKALQLGVAFPAVPIAFPRLRKWVLKEDKEIGYQYLENREIEYQPQDLFVWNEVANALLNLVEPIRELTVEEKKIYGESEDLTARDSTPSEKIVSFLNTYGQVGLADYHRRLKFNRPHTTDRGELTPEQFRVLVDLPDYQRKIDREKQSKALASKFQDNKFRLERINRISWGYEIPLNWVERDLFDLYKCVRILLALRENQDEFDSPLFSLTLKRSRALRRFLLASQRVAVPLGEGEDFRYLKDKRWQISDKIIETEWEMFVWNLNRFLFPITKNVIYTQKSLEQSNLTMGVETWISYQMLQSEARYSEGICLNPKCQKAYVGQKITKKYCDTACATTARSRKFRAKKKNSSGRSQKKAKAKGKKRNA